MKNLRTLFLLLAFAPAPAAADDATLVKETLERFHAALGSGDRQAALALLADDALIVEAGSIETLKEYRDHHLDADIEFAKSVPATRIPLRVVVEGNAAWAVSNVSASGSFRGKPISTQSAELAVLSRTPSGWRIRAVHWSARPVRAR